MNRINEIICEKNLEQALAHHEYSVNVTLVTVTVRAIPTFRDLEIDIQRDEMTSAWPHRTRARTHFLWFPAQFTFPFRDTNCSGGVFLLS